MSLHSCLFFFFDSIVVRVYIYIYFLFFSLSFSGPLYMAVFGNGLDWRKLTDIVADLIDVKEKVRMFYI
jgi:hypothetical protein